MAKLIQVGEWTFSPHTAALWKGDVRRRLEHRAAQVLDLLCARKGEPVSHAELVEKVWGGRELSRNSVAVVIGDLRRALEDDAREPRVIETIPKRGYRIVAEVSVNEGGSERALSFTWTSAPAPVRALLIGAAVLGVVGLGLGGWQWAVAARAPSIVVSDFLNETTYERYDALTATTTEMVTAELASHGNLRVVSRSGPDTQIRVRGSVAMWEGAPAIYLFAEDISTGDVIWSGIASGPEGRLPAQVREQINAFVESNAPSRARETD
jgi:DNA-binding winged helix-turn-helix (wHTH) protein